MSWGDLLKRERPQPEDMPKVKTTSLIERGKKDPQSGWKARAKYNPSQPHTFSSFASKNLNEIVDAVKGKTDAEVASMLKTLINDIEQWIHFHTEE